MMADPMKEWKYIMYILAFYIQQYYNRAQEEVLPEKGCKL